MSHTPEEPNLSVRDIQKVIDETVVSLVVFKSTGNLTKAKQKYIDQLVNELQKCSRSLPELDDKKVVKESVLSIVAKVMNLWKEFFKS